jgi:hypothetical protein
VQQKETRIMSKLFINPKYHQAARKSGSVDADTFAAVANNNLEMRHTLDDLTAMAATVTALRTRLATLPDLYAALMQVREQLEPIVQGTVMDQSKPYTLGDVVMAYQSEVKQALHLINNALQAAQEEIA